MSFTSTYSREQLQGLKAEYRKQQLHSHIEQHISNAVLQAARQGKKEYHWVSPFPKKKNYLEVGANLGLVVLNQVDSYFTNEELVEGLKEKFPGTRIEYQETWVDVRAGVKEQNKGILIDWS